MSIIINSRQIIKDGITSLRDVWSSSKVSAELSGKQATLVSGTNIKTINNTSLLGSGDITISGGGDIPKINMTATTATLDPNKFYVWGEVASLNISLAAETAGIENVYKFQFQSGETATTLTLPNSVKWSESITPTIFRNTTYIISIESDIAKIERAFTTSLLPAEYQQVEWIECSGLQFINTEINGTGDLEVVAEIKGYVGSYFGFGSRDTSNTNAVFLANGGTTGNRPSDYYFCYANSNTGSAYSAFNDGAKHEYCIDKGTLKVDGYTLYTFAESGFASNSSLYVFSLNQAGTRLGSYKYKCYLFSVKRNSVKLADLYPCYRIADNVAGMYDIVRDVFLTNAGSGSFIVGPDV